MSEARRSPWRRFGAWKCRQGWHIWSYAWVHWVDLPRQPCARADCKATREWGCDVCGGPIYDGKYCYEHS